MKRFFPLLLVLLLIPCMIVPASATTQDVVDALTNSNGQPWLMGVYNVLVDIRTDIEDSITVILEAIKARIESIQGKLSGTLPDGAYSIGEISALIFTKLQEAVDSLGWIDSQIRDVETAVLNGFTETTGKLTSILEEMYTNGTLTIGECVKGIRSYIVNINEKLETGAEQAIGAVTVTIKNTVSDIYAGVNTIAAKVHFLTEQVKLLLSGDADQAGEVADNADQQSGIIEGMTQDMNLAPEISQDKIDSVISDANGKFQNITSDESGTILFGSMGQLANMNVFKQLIPTSAMLGVISFALFGRVF